MSKKSKAIEFAQDVYEIHVTGRNVLVTEAMKDYAIEKISKIEKFFDRIIDVMVTMDIQKLDHRVDIVFKVNNLKIKSHATTNDMYASIDLAVNKLERQVLKYKNRLQQHHTKGVSEIDMNVNVIENHKYDDDFDINDQIDEENSRQIVDVFKPHKIVAREKRPLRQLTVDEAIMKMDLSQDVFMIFRCEEDRKIKVIYRRKDGNFGLFEPE